MPNYYFHIIFELHPFAGSSLEASSTASDSTAGLWLPPTDACIFDDLPSHPRRSQIASYTTDRLQSYPNPASGSRRRLPSSTKNPADSSRTAGNSRTRCGQASDHINHPQTSTKDWRFGRVSVETIALKDSTGMTGIGSEAGPSAAPSLGPNLGGAGAVSKAALVPLEAKNTELGWGVVHFYRDGEETPPLDSEAGSHATDETQTQVDCTTLCIPAVPAYMSPADFIGFVGERYRADISHCRLVMTSKMNRYLALLKFRNSERAKQWKKNFDGRVFNAMEPQVCHVVFVKSITFETPTLPNGYELSNGSSSSTGASSSFRPFPPPTPSLVELPTCPVCLERMDETSGLMTIPCSHVFHCTCLQSWRGTGCPVCRFTNASQDMEHDPVNPFTEPFGSSVSNLCSVCDCADDLWICLICGYVGCGRYKGAHAKDHWKETAHSFALELETQYVWDYAGDMWVHRLIRDKGDGKVVELPGRSGQTGDRRDEDVVPRAKLDNIGLEYTHLITSQLESQRAYYEEMLSKAVDKASKASTAAESAAEQASEALKKLSLLDEKYRSLSQETIPQMERELEREKNKATKGENLARSLGKSLQEEKRVNEGLLKRIEHLNEDNEKTRKRASELDGEIAELKEMNRDLSMFISGQEKLKEMENEGQLAEGELEAGSASVPEKKGRRRGKR